MPCDCKNCIVRSLTILSDLNFQELEKVSALIYLKVYKRKKIVFLEETPSHTVYILKSGNIKTYKSLPDGREQIINILLPGDMLGFDSLYDDRYSCTAEVIQDAELCCIRKQDLINLLTHNPEVGLKFIKIMNRELNKAQDRIRDLGLKDARERVASLLMTLFTSRGEGQGPGFTLSRQEISEMVGVAQETVIRMLSEFKSDGIIRTEGKNIFVVNPEELKRWAGEMEV
jgi:CRP/FNR family transcriptional regulator